MAGLGVDTLSCHVASVAGGDSGRPLGRALPKSNRREAAIADSRFEVRVTPEEILKIG